MLRNAKGQSGNTPEESPFVKAVEDWWNSFSPRLMSRGNIAGGLVLLENLRDNFDLDINSHKASASDQLKNATRSSVQKILARFGEARVLLKEGGRTNRGLVKNLGPLLDSLSDTGLGELPPENRDVEIAKMQFFLVERARDKFNAEKLSFEYNRDTTSRELIGMILESAFNRRKSGEVAEYLVGAKLALRFPNYEIRNSAASAADEQTEDRGDFEINDCVFHVTVAPNSGHYDKCKANLADGLRVFLLVPDKILVGTRQNAELAGAGRVSVESIESFVSQNIEELSEFASEKVSQNMRLLLATYNERISRVELDLSLQIRIPTAMDK